MHSYEDCNTGHADDDVAGSGASQAVRNDRYMGVRIAMPAGSAPDDEKNAGATATIALVRRDKLVIANVGDSRAVLSRK